MIVEEKKEPYETNPKVDMKRIRMMAHIIVSQQKANRRLARKISEEEKAIVGRKKK